MNWWRLKVGKPERNSRKTQSWGNGSPHFCEFYLYELYQVLTVNIWEKHPPASSSRRRKANTFKYTGAFSFLQCLSWLGWGEENTQLQSTLANPNSPRGGKSGEDWEASVKFTVQKHRLTKRLRPNHRTVECLLSPAHLTTKNTPRFIPWDNLHKNYLKMDHRPKY